jgi:hypothetical protein
MQEHVFDGVEQAAVSAILRDILCDAVSQPVAVASSSDLVAISGHAAMQNAMMQCSISCVGSRSDPQQLPLISPDTKAVLQTASSVLRELSGEQLPQQPPTFIPSASPNEMLSAQCIQKTAIFGRRQIAYR